MNIHPKHPLIPILLAGLIAGIGIRVGFADTTLLQDVQSTIPQPTDTTVLDNNYNNFLTAIGKNPTGNLESSNQQPVIGDVNPHFSELATGGTSAGATGGLSVSTSANTALGIDVNNLNGAGVMVKTTGLYGILATGNDVAVYSKGSNMGAYAYGYDYGLSSYAQKIGIKAVSSEGYGTVAVGRHSTNGSGLTAEAEYFGIIGIGKSAGVAGMNINTSTEGYLGYEDNGLYYGIYTPNSAVIDGQLDVTKTVSVSGGSENPSTVAGTLTASNGNAPWIFIPNNLYSSSSLDITWYANMVSILSLDGSSLEANGDFSVYNNLEVADIIDGSGSEFGITSDVNFFGNLNASGLLTSDTEIGRFYFRESSIGTSVDVSCDEGDLLVGCSGQVIHGDGTIAAATPNESTCQVKSGDSSTSVVGYAFCFDPEGTAAQSSATSLSDTDSDGWPDFSDNCPSDANEDQADTDGDGVGDACEEATCTPEWWALDADSDTYMPYGSTSLQNQCSAPSSSYIPINNLTSLANDCDDNTKSVNPGATENCTDGVDNDCNGYVDSEDPACAPTCTGIFWFIDTDGDKWTPEAYKYYQCDQPEGSYISYAELSGYYFDCDDTNAEIHPETYWFKDADNDDISDYAFIRTCERPTGYKLLSELDPRHLVDCDDSDPSILNAPDYTCDGDNDNFIDGSAGGDDCNDNDSEINPDTSWWRDFDNDLFGILDFKKQCTRPTDYKTLEELSYRLDDCNDDVASINPGAEEICNDGIDNDCDGDIDFNDSDCAECNNNDQQDCGDTDTNTGQCNIGVKTCTGGKWGGCKQEVPPSTEVCDGVDNDCDGLTDEEVKNTYYEDADGDSYGSDNTTQACSVPSGYVTNSDDCNDGDGAINPAAREICDDGIDNNCNDYIDSRDVQCNLPDIEEPGPTIDPFSIDPFPEIPH